jgi:spore germination cell wall hydrolase CwlJ-like protein
MLSPEWTQHWDEEVGSHYYFNSTTGEATWVQPT